ncbi:MAG: phosphoribosylaminoimidazolesuccinocarboxamide synthase, partial [Methanoregulaceae archaeon]|nr:phosphoribosylaminoimidazolesuccinocarboxamide synthase [Methanoregulaceae archaeon]
VSLRINTLLREYLAARGVTLVDFKLEFGRQDGEIYLGDEISMDSMRLWDASGESLDKDVYRFEKGDVIERYRQVAALIVLDSHGGK